MPGCRAIASGPLLLYQARAVGVRAAMGDVVIIAEEHCLPDPDCVERLLDRLTEGFDAVGPALCPGTATAAAEASFLLCFFSAVTFTGLGAGQSATFSSLTGFITVVPEPATHAISLIAMAVIASLMRRRTVLAAPS